MSAKSNPRALFSTPTRKNEGSTATLTPKTQTKPKEKFIKPAAPKTPLASANYERCIQARRAMSADRSPATPKIKTTRTNPILRSSSENCVADNIECSRMTVAVRIRPLLVKELPMEVSSIEISPDGKELVVNDNLKKYTFKLDHCLGKDTSQSSMFSIIAQPLLDASFNGYNVCLFAYGQTGSGKSYSMMGDNLDSSLTEKAGIIPRFCHQLFDQIPSKMVAQVKISYLEIYNEIVYDLLSNERKALKVRESPDTGIFVSDLSVHGVSSFSDMQKWLSEGNKARVTASTCMNDKSSRSHSIFQIQLTLTEDTGSTITQKCSQINLVDLAGSERVAQTKATEERFKEGRNINLSLMTLGQVITNLSDHSTIPPYRNSTLTYLLKLSVRNTSRRARADLAPKWEVLCHFSPIRGKVHYVMGKLQHKLEAYQDSLGGNSRTTMLATINPLQSHIEESLATLRYALQARNIVNTIRKNQDCKETCLRCQNIGLLENLKFKEWHTKISEAETEARRKNEYICTMEFQNETLMKQIEYKNSQLLEFEEGLREKMKQKDDQVLELANIVKTYEEELQELRTSSRNAEEQLTIIKGDFQDLQEKYQRELNQKSETIRNEVNKNLALKIDYEKRIDKKDTKIKELVNNSNEINIEMSKKDAEIDRLLKENERLNMDLVFKENQEVTEIMKEVDRKDQYIETLLKENEGNVKLCKELEKQVHELNINKELDRLNHEIIHKDEEIRQNSTTIKQLMSEIASKETSIKKLIKQNNGLMEKVKTAEEKSKALVKSKDFKDNENKLDLKDVQDENRRLEDILKENECERAGLLTKEKRKEEEIKRLKEELIKHKKLVEEKEAQQEQSTKDIAYFENMKDKLEAEIERLEVESVEKIKLRDKELDKKHEVIAEMKLAMDESRKKIEELKEELIHERALIREQEVMIQCIQKTLLAPIPPVSDTLIRSRRSLLQKLDIILGLTPDIE